MTKSEEQRLFMEMLETIRLPEPTWKWFPVPNRLIALPIPADWHGVMSDDLTDWLVRPEEEIIAGVPRPSIRGVSIDVSGGPEYVKRALQAYRQDFEMNQLIEILKTYHDPEQIFPSYGFRYSHVAGNPRVSRIGHKLFIGFLESGYVLNLNATAPAELWAEAWPILERALRNLFVIEAIPSPSP